MTTNEDKELGAMKVALGALEPLEAEQRERVLRWLAERLGVSIPTPAGGAGVLGAKPHAGDVSLTPRQFLALKKPRTDIERIACLGYYLTNMRETPHFKTNDLTVLNTEAAGRKFSNAAVPVSNATLVSGYLTPAGKGNKQITPLGEAVVDALPDREAVKQALAEHPKQKRRKAVQKKKASAK